jgi:hypothetical protein
MNFPFNDNNVTINTTRIKEYLDKEDCEISERHRKEANEKGVDPAGLVHRLGGVLGRGPEARPA